MITDLKEIDRKAQEDFPIETWVRIGKETLERQGCSLPVVYGVVRGYADGEIFGMKPRTEAYLAVYHHGGKITWNYYPANEAVKIEPPARPF